MHVRFLLSSDWQLGVTRHFLDADAQARWSAARFDAVRNLGQIAMQECCEFIVVAGNIFESNQVDRRTVGKTCSSFAVCAWTLAHSAKPSTAIPSRFIDFLPEV